MFNRQYVCCGYLVETEGGTYMLDELPLAASTTLFLTSMSCTRSLDLPEYTPDYIRELLLQRGPKLRFFSPLWAEGPKILHKKTMLVLMTTMICFNTALRLHLEQTSDERDR